MIDWAARSLCEAADAIAGGRASAREVAEACIDRIARLDKHLNCFVEHDPEIMVEAAEAADAALRRGVSPGLLHGVPLAHKDIYYRSGRVAACGSRVRNNEVQTETATVLTKLDDAGAIETGRLVMVEFALGPHGYNANYPLCRNAWHPDYIPCGSSSGSGVAVSAGMAFGSLGSDTGGSIRCPAAASGVVGLAPTRGRVSRSGVMPMSFSLDVVGPIARRVRDCARLLSVIAGCDRADPTSTDVPVDSYEAALEAPNPWPRIGVARGYFDEEMHPEVAAAVVGVVDTFRRLGFEVEDVAMPTDDLQAMSNLHPLIMKAEGAANHMEWMRVRPEDYTPEVRNRLQAGFFVPATDYIQALKLRGRFLSGFLRNVFASVDLLLTPVLSGMVPTIGETSNRHGAAYLDMVSRLTRNTKVVNYLGLPAISVPCGFTSNGLPTAFQLIGRPWSEAWLLGAAHRYEQATDWHRRQPPIVSEAAGV